MFLAKVIGTVVATRKDPKLVGTKILVVQPINTNEDPIRNTEVVIDSVGAGVGETVIVATGSSARRAYGDGESPIDSAIVGIVDSVEIMG